MSNAEHDSVDAYIEQKPPAIRGVLRCVREAIRSALPTAEECMSYAIPTYKINGRPVLYFAGWKQHYSVYPASEKVVSECADDLAPYQVQKGTIRFPLSEPVPLALIEGIARIRASEVGQVVGETIAPRKTATRQK